MLKMGELSVENGVCDACGTEIRAQALFCYNCGAAVAEKIASSKNRKNHKSVLTKKIVDKKEIKSPSENNLIEQTEKASESNEQEIETREKAKGNGNKDVKLKSAAALRNKARRLEPKKLEIIWEEHDNAPNLWFIGIAVLLIIFTIIIYFIAMALK